MKEKRGPIDFVLFADILVLLSIGVCMVFSASMPEGERFYGSPYYYLIRQSIWATLGVIVMLFTSNIDYKFWRNKNILSIGFIVVVLMLIAVFLFPPVKGARRWLGFGFAKIQPSEIAKIFIVLFLSNMIDKKGPEKMKSLTKGLLPGLIVMAIFVGLIIKEPNLSTSVIIATVSMILLFVGGAQIKYMIGLFLLGVAAVAGAILVEPYRLRRLVGFMNPWADKLDTGYQAIQSLYALGSGGLFGRGFGFSMQKFHYIPEAQNDFIFSILGEELGFIGTFFVIICFSILIWRGIRIAINCKDKFGSLVALGITSIIAVQSSVNFLVVSSFMPVTGVTLPLISYGGSSLLFTMAGLGILLNISRYITKDGVD
ncbi:putative lipid II flippase FtsW [Thermobrachium celere]|uniref:Probable peptidoglycan glycosyltransferase FtsW n=1 Tax=Thermobrachium celere DSM 8682 TaxID=941824 RepID=R7RP43_9CLOT|nr:putative lipid II flippase FtsW [Thermobrachium celere]GFR35001.1 stage V sporulation protein E [Thermobrachium celere]CDF57829.1 Cell division protein FtsW [Thermobrachium celere DSM 8682]